ncbi:MAG: hypothetical protein ACRD7E_07050 [Bryobacteraceae bacterium]
MKAENYKERKIELDGWPVNLSSYKIGSKYYCQADNVSPGACLARMEADTPEDAERQAIEKARKLLARTRVFSA